MAPFLTLKLSWAGEAAGELSSQAAKWLENQVVEQLSIQEAIEAKVVRGLKSWRVK